MKNKQKKKINSDSNKKLAENCIEITQKKEKTKKKCLKKLNIKVTFFGGSNRQQKINKKHFFTQKNQFLGNKSLITNKKGN